MRWNECVRVAFCIFKYFPFGGIQRDLRKFADECVRRGHQVRVYTASWQDERPQQIDVRVAPVNALFNHTRYERFATWVAAQEAADPSDLVVGLNKMPGLDVYYAGDSCYEHKARTQRGFFYRCSGRYRSFHAAERAVFEPGSATQILTISDIHTPDFRRFYGTQPERFHRLPPGIEKDRRAPETAEARRAARLSKRASLGHSDDELVLLFLGSGFIKKGLDRVLHAVKALPPDIYAKLTLYVIGRDKAEPFRRMAARQGIAERVVFFDEGRDDVPEFLWAADGLVLPAYDENAGMVILEAMIAGLPALVTRNCGYAHYLAEAQAGIVLPAPFEQANLNRALVRLLTSRERQGWAAAGRAFAGTASLYELVPKAVDYFERFARLKQGSCPLRR